MGVEDRAAVRDSLRSFILAFCEDGKACRPQENDWKK